ncbi:MAG: mannose-1-phosphate guanylyltransferase/mannose-6-phosphate isomerase [Desulfobacteraceae bacterium]|nr:MAG: mannose-1-phosphate guanylyltransferase/mannose-6-phosphate isomerase [Desulfobacteraceae bacterium]
MNRTYAVLLAGGTGTRMWPVSRERFPKQLVNFIGKDSLVQSTIKRLSPALDPENVRIVCGEEHFHEITRHISEIGLHPEGKVICEPCGRNTAPAVLLAVLHLLKTEDDAVIFVFPADHVIRSTEIFHQKIASAMRLAERGRIVTFGIQPDYPETGYGYIEGAERLEEGALSIRRFVEKPDRKTAESYIAAGNFFWNSGMFAFRGSVLVEEYRRWAPGLLQSMKEMTQRGEVAAKEYRSLPDISIDYAIMEKTEKGAVLPSDFGWSDIGSWKSLYDFLPKDGGENVIDGDVIAKDTRNCFILGTDRLIATNRIRNLVVVETPDSVFVSDLENSRDVKEIVSDLKARGREEFKTHRTAYFPWGTQTILDAVGESKVERIRIYPGKTFEDGNQESTRVAIVSGGNGNRMEAGRAAPLQKGDLIRIPPGQKAVIASTGREAFTFIRITISG